MPGRNNCILVKVQTTLKALYVNITESFYSIVIFIPLHPINITWMSLK